MTQEQQQKKIMSVDTQNDLVYNCELTGFFIDGMEQIVETECQFLSALDNLKLQPPKSFEVPLTDYVSYNTTS